MRLLSSFSLFGRILILLNCLFFLLAAALSLLFFIPTSLDRWVAGQRRDWEIQGAVTRLSAQALQVWENELQWAEIESRQLAAQASQIFSHPDSFPLSAQPGEYDFEKKTGVYASVKSDDSLALVLSVATSLTPDLLRDIRLAEYLSPSIKNLLDNRPHFRRAYLLTADSLLATVPWIDFPERIKAGKFQRDFKAQDFAWFEKIRLDPNSGKKPLWIWDSPGLSPEFGGVFCLLPFFASGQFKGVVILEFQARAVADKLFDGAGFAQEAIFLLEENERLVGCSLEGAELLKLPTRSITADAPLYLKQLSSSLIHPWLLHLGRVWRVGEFWGVAVRTEPMNSSLVVCLPARSQAEIFLPPGPSDFKSKLVVTILWIVSAVLLLGNILWIFAARKKIEHSPRHLAESLAALNGLEKDKEVLKGQTDELGDVYQRFDVSLQRVRQALGGLRTDMPDSENPQGPFSDAVGEIRLLSERVRLLSCFNITENLEAGLSHLCRLLCEFFGSAQAVVLLYSPGEKLFRSFQTELNGKSDSSDRLSYQMVEGSFLEVVYNTRQPNFAELTDLSAADSEGFGRIASQNLLLCPLFYRKAVFGVVVLADRQEGWTADHSLHFSALEETLSRVLNNLLQNERWRKIDLLRREYCVELAKTIETPLNRIRDEVQAIHHRLGRLTPYYKEHCEAILFETGILYQIAHEVREMEEKEQLKDSPTQDPG